MAPQNGMTPLHLAVWHALHAEDPSTVGTLLKYNADCSIVDDVGGLFFPVSSSDCESPPI